MNSSGLLLSQIQKLRMNSRGLQFGLLSRMLHCGLLLAGCCAALLGAGTSPGLSITIEGAFIARVQTWDLNHDGEVTCEEWRSYATSLFKEADGDHVGKLIREEFAKLAKIDWLFEVANFDYYDVNKQGYVTQADFVNRPNPAFEALDHDKSCLISLNAPGAIEESGWGSLICKSEQGEEECSSGSHSHRGGRGGHKGSGGNHSGSIGSHSGGSGGSGSHSSDSHSGSGYSSGRDYSGISSSHRDSSGSHGGSGYIGSSSGYSSGSSSSGHSSSGSSSSSSSKSNCPNPPPRGGCN